MKTQKRPFVVEIRHKRGAPKQPPSIWGDVDLAGAADAVRNEAGEGTARAKPAEQPSPTLIAAPPTSVPARASDVEDVNAQVALGAELPKTPADRQAARQTKADAPARRRQLRELLLPRSERWKLRLPEVLQPSQPWSIRRSVLRKRARAGKVGS